MDSVVCGAPMPSATVKRGKLGKLQSVISCATPLIPALLTGLIWNRPLGAFHLNDFFTNYGLSYGRLDAPVFSHALSCDIINIRSKHIVYLKYTMCFDQPILIKT